MREQSRVPEQPPAAPPEPPRPAPRRRRWLRWLVRGLLGLILLVVLVVLGVVAYVQTPGGGARVLAFGVRAANEALAGKLSAGSLLIQGGHIVLRDVTLETPEGERVAHVDEVEVRVSLFPLIGKRVHLSLVRLQHPEVWLTFDEEGPAVLPVLTPPAGDVSVPGERSHLCRDAGAAATCLPAERASTRRSCRRRSVTTLPSAATSNATPGSQTRSKYPFSIAGRPYHQVG